MTTGCVSCVSGDGIDGGPVWWTDPYTAWAAKKKLDSKNKRKAGEASIDADTEARLKALRGEGGSSGDAATSSAAGGGGSSGGGGGGGMSLDPDVEARLRALRGDAAPSDAGGKQESYTTKGYDSD